MSKNQFSLASLDDHLQLSQDCIKPLQILNRKPKQARTPTEKAPVSISLTDDGEYFETNTATGNKKILEQVQISLNDCLACSGCITSAESVLITQQSKKEFFSILESQPNRQLVVTVSPQVRASLAAYFNLSALQTFQKLTSLFQSFGAKLVVDSSFSRDFSLHESVKEFCRRFKNANATNKSPILASACPGWICYAEKTQGDMLPYISNVKSPQQIMGSLVKQHLASTQLHATPDNIYHVALMPCFDKKLEASRDDFYDDVYKTRDVDTVLTSLEIIEILQDRAIDFKSLPDADIDPTYVKINKNKALTGLPGGSGGYALYILRKAALKLFNISDPVIHEKVRRNNDFKEMWIEVDGKKVLHFAIAYGFRNIQTLVRMIKSKKCDFDYVEVMACPAGIQ